MSHTKQNSSDRIIRTAVQKMESLQQAGLQMLTKVSKSKSVGSVKNTT